MNKTICKGGQPGNQNAVKDDGEKATSFLHIRVTPAQKAYWVHAAGGRKLSEWVIEALNQHCNKSQF